MGLFDKTLLYYSFDNFEKAFKKEIIFITKYKNINMRIIIIHSF